MEIGMGYMGLSSEAFWDMTLREFVNKQKGFFNYQKFLQEEEWRRTRRMIKVLIGPHLKKGAKFEEWDIIRLPGDPEPKASGMTPEQRAALNAKMDAIVKKMHEKKNGELAEQ